MSGRTNHAVAGTVFVVVCIVAALLLYLGLRPTATPAEAQNQERDVRKLEAAADAYEQAAEALEAEERQDARPLDDRIDGEPQGASLQEHSAFRGFRFADYPAGPMSGSTALPELRGDRETLAAFRTALLEQATMGANFAGHYRIAQVGCGTHCVFSFIIDLQTGVVTSFAPRGRNGEDAAGEYWETRPDSRLILDVAPEEDEAGDPRCSYVAYRWGNGHAEPLGSPVFTASDGWSCD